MNKKTITTNKFMQDFIELAKKEQKQAIKTIRLMAENMKHPSLNSHKVKGTPYEEVYVNKDVRIIFENNSDTNVLHRIGHHDILDKL